MSWANHPTADDYTRHMQQDLQGQVSHLTGSVETLTTVVKDLLKRLDALESKINA